MDRIKIISIFKSIDGEAYNAGRPTVFLRTYGCNIRCSYCDTAESWSMQVHSERYKDPIRELTPEAAVEEIIALAGATRHVTITGGEPLLPENVPWMQELTARLLAKGFCVDFETNGAVPLKDMAEWRESLRSLADRVRFIMDWKCPGSKMNAKMLPENLGYLTPIDVVKCVVMDEDFDEVLAVRARLDEATTVYISPCFGQVTMSRIPDFVVAHDELNFKCQLQQHKIFYPVSAVNV